MTWHSLPARARTLFYLQAFSRLALFWLPATAVAVAALTSAWSLRGALGVGGAWLLFQGLLAVWMPALEHAHFAWTERDSDLLVSRGVLVRTVTAIPAQRIQHVDVRQGLLERSLGLARLMVYTASGAGADGVIPGLTLDTAEALRDRLVSVGGDDGV
ncbi:MAG: PH domain-containing protein [Alphaproteobacteria bacterium]|nr:PH domain-containing protein [Alphaproteobacteria bacterium]